jgi:hypothetical protein
MVMNADALGLDFESKKGFLTNGFSTMPAMVVPHCIGPKIVHDIEPYIFHAPPTVHASGVIPLSEDISVADLRFDIVGDQFEWLRFHSPHVSGVVNWQGKDLNLTDMKADFYDGKLSGRTSFNFQRDESANFGFDIVVADANLHSLMTDVTRGTNGLEGKLSGHLNISKANTDDPKSWFGGGHVTLRDGMIWEFPVFGILSPVLNSFSPGLGKARISDATASFAITNSVIRSQDLSLKASTFQLLYDGTIDFNLRVDATVEADLGHGMPVLGPFVSMVFTPFGKLFETRVTGTVTNPKSEPLRLGRLLNPFFHPWDTLKELVPGTGPVNNTGPPPVWPTDGQGPVRSQ